MKKMKIVSLLLFMILLLSAMTISVYAADTAADLSLTVTNPTCYRGDTVVIRASLTNIIDNSGIEGVDIEGIHYDESKLTLVSVTKESLPAEWVFLTSEDRVMIADDSGGKRVVKENDKIVIKLTFKISEDAAFGPTTVSVSGAATNGNLDYVSLNIPALQLTVACNHVFDQEIVDAKYQKAPANCIQGATYYKSCACGEAGKDPFVHGEALGHNFTGYVSNNDATCTQDGSETATCSRCGETDIRTLPDSKTEHSYGETWVSGEEGHHRVCIACQAPSATETHTSSSAASCTEDEVCVTCGFVMTLKTGHTYTETVVPPTCLAEGYTTYVCSACEDTYTGDKTSAKGHTESDWIVDVEPSVGTGGMKHIECVDCGEVLKMDKIEALTAVETEAESETEKQGIVDTIVEQTGFGTKHILMIGGGVLALILVIVVIAIIKKKMSAY